MLIKGAEPFYLKGNHIGCVLIHGLTGSPSEMRLLGEFLNNKGYTVIAPLLPGHGTKPADILKYKWQDWYAEVEQALKDIKKDCSKTYLMGLSMGGLLALYGASQGLPISGIVSMAAPIYLSTKVAFFAPILKYFIKNIKKDKISDVFEGHRRTAYNVQVVHGVNEMLKLRRKVKRYLPQIRKPVLIVQSRDDKMVLAESAQYIHDHLGASLKSIKWLSSSEHIVTMGPEREEMFAQIDSFIHNVK
jgi:carboxylesterase